MSHVTLNVPASILTNCASEAARFTPLETGGIFLGRYDSDGARVVEHMVGPGPNARHDRRWLEVDHEWQNAQIVALSTIGASIEYLGEWHSHPAAMHGTLSTTDERTLLKLSRFKLLRCSDPIMLIAFPTADNWDFAGWRLNHQKRAWQLLTPWVWPAQIHVNAG